MGRKLKTYTVRGLAKTQNAIISILNTIKDALLRIFGFFKYLEWVFIIVCLVGVWHYFCVFYPRYTTDDVHFSRIQNLGIDYWGIIVGFLAMLVTLLVGWNIYSTIKAKEDSNQHNKKLEEDYTVAKKRIEDLPKSLEESIATLSACCEQRKNEVEQLRRDLDLKLNKIELKAIKANAMLQMTNARQANKDYEKRLFGEVCRLFVDVLVLEFKIKDDRGEINRCRESLIECLDELKKSNQKFVESTYIDCKRNLDAILESSDFSP